MIHLIYLIEKISIELNSSKKGNIISSTLNILPSLATVCPEIIIDNFEQLKIGLDKTCFISNENSLILMSILSSLFVADDIHDDYNEQLYMLLFLQL